MTKKTYSYGAVTYGYSLKMKKWNFTSPNKRQMLIACGGVETAHKVATQVDAGFRRSKTDAIDGLARAQIARLTQ